MTVYPDTGYSAIDYNDGLFADPDSTHLHSLTMRTVGTGVGTAMHSYDFYDGRGAVVRHFEDYTAADGGNATTDIEYDVMGRVKRVSNPYYATNGTLTPTNPPGLWTTNVYDELGRVKQVTLTDQTTVQTIYAGTITTVTDQAGKQRRQKVDALGRVVRVDEPNDSGQLGDISSPAQSTSYEYDKLDNLIHITQVGSGGITQHRYFKYDSLSRLTHERQVEQAAPYTTADSVAGNNLWSKKLIYDTQGLLSDAYDARQVRTEFGYDGLNRVNGITYTGESAPTQTPAVTYTYDQQHTNYYNKGRLTEVKTAATANAPQTIQAYDYDKMGRVKSHSQSVGSTPYTTSYSYNIAGWLMSQTYPSGKVVSYGYDEAARLANVKDTTNQQAVKPYVNSLSYAAHGGMSGATLGNGAVEGVLYNDRLQPKIISLTKDSNILQKYEYKYGQVDQATGVVDETKNNGQIARVEGFIGTARQWQQRFSYDSIGRVSTAGEYQGDTLAQTYQSTLSYDRFGNRYQKQSQNSQSLPFTAIEDADINQATNRLTTSTSYDNAGNVTVDNKFRGRQYRYDANGRMWWSANVDNTGEATSVYDALGQRVRTTANGNTKIMVYDALGRMIAEYDSQAQSGTGGTKYLMSDVQGSTRVVTDGSGSVMARRDYQAFGGEIGAGTGLRTPTQKYAVSDSTRQRYALTERDATGLEHTWWRKYDSSSGRWTTPDPYHGSMSVGDPQSFNRYSYVQNDPVNFVDPSGLLLCVGEGCRGTQPDYSGLWSLFWGRWEIDSPVDMPVGGGEPGGGGGGIVSVGGIILPKKQLYVDLDVLNSCTDKLFGVTTLGLVQVLKGKNGSFTGFGPDGLNNSGNYAIIGIEHDVKSYSTAQLSALAPPSPGYVVTGLTYPGRPYTNFGANDPNRTSMQRLTTQIHELGHSLQAIITGNPNWEGTKTVAGFEAGKALVNCVKQKGGFKYS